MGCGVSQRAVVEEAGDVPSAFGFNGPPRLGRICSGSVRLVQPRCSLLDIQIGDAL